MTIAQWQAMIVANKAANASLAGVDSTSLVADWLLWTWVMAFVAWTLEGLLGAHVVEVQGIIGGQKPHSLQWYTTMAKLFQYGYALPDGSDVYVPAVGAGDASLVVTFAAGVESENLVRIKVATGAVGALGPLTAPQLSAFTAYMNLVKDAGVRVVCTSGVADTCQPKMVIYYDPLVLDGTGARLDGTGGTPVRDAINAFLDSIPFNGRFVLNNFIAAMQAVPGVVVADEVSVLAYYGAVPPVAITTWYTPDAGYMGLDLGYFNVNVSYQPYA